MVKVFHVNSNYLTSRLHENLVEKLEDRGISNTVYMPIKEETKIEFLYESDYDVHSPVTFKNCEKYIFSLKQGKIIRTMEKTFDMGNYDICHAHTLFTDGNVAHRIYKKYGIPYIVTVRGMTDIDGFFKKRVNLRRKGRRILKDAAQIVFLSVANKNELFENYLKGDVEEYEKKSVIIPNGIDDFWFENENQPKTIQPDKKLKLVYVGKLKKSKNVLQAIEAMRVLKSKYNQESQITVVGKVVDQGIHDEVKATTDVLVKLLPQTPREELLNIYRQNDIFIMPSFTETFGLVYPEALSQGLPVIYTKNQGFDKHFPDGQVGYAVDPYSAENIADSIMKIIKNYETISKTGLEKYRKFNWNNLSDIYEEMYRNLKK